MEKSIKEMVEDIKGKLKLVNKSVLNEEMVREDKKDELKEIHSMVMSRDNITPREMDAITQALGDLRK